MASSSSRPAVIYNALTINPDLVADILDVSFPAEVLFTNYDPADLESQARMRPCYLGEDGPILSVHSFVVQTRERLVLVDACTGNDKPRFGPLFDYLQTNFLAELEAAGAPVDAVDTELCTHLHLDHVDGGEPRVETPTPFAGAVI